MHLRQLTVRGFDPELQKVLEALSEEEGISLSQAALKLMREGAGLRLGWRRKQIGGSLDRFVGSMSQEEGREILEATEIFEQTDPEFWK
ncbi:MAG: hypothetical protein AB1758_02465 [Candidatus Eremiobacterota bacterium]